MIRQVLIFVIAAGVGALLALAVRSAWHRPYAAPSTDTSTAHGHHAPAKKPADDPHAGHATGQAP